MTDCLRCGADDHLSRDCPRHTSSYSTPGASPILLRASALESTGVTRYFLGTVRATTVVLANPSTTDAVNVKICIAGDVTEAAC